MYIFVEMSSQKASTSVEEPLIGIDFGTINSCVYVWINGEAILVTNGQGKSTTPSVVAFIDGHRFIGATAKSKLEMYPKQTITEVKRLMGLRFCEVTDKIYLPSTQYTIKPDSAGLATIEITDGENEFDFTPIEISAMILKELKSYAEKFVRKSIKKAVVTVPEHFNNCNEACR